MAFKKGLIFFIIVISSLFAFRFFLCKQENTIVINYTLNYETDSWHKNKTGLLWALSYLGAELPKASFESSIKWIDTTTFKLSFDKLGFNSKALNAIQQLTDSIKQTEQYQKNGHIDLAQFVVLTIGSSWHYYAITGFPKNYQTYLNEHNFSNAKQFPITNSTVSKHHRLIKFMISDSILKTVFIADEGTGNLRDGNFEVQFHEVMDVMPNGQLRFAIYNAQNNLVADSPKSFGEAGKPAKCIWCHEIVFQPLFVETDSLFGEINPREFQHIIEKQNFVLKAYREKLKSDIDFNKTQDHSFMELLYISYMEPSIKKLSKEWNIEEARIKVLFKDEITHHHNEFDFLNNIYFRNNIEKHSPYQFIQVSEDVREPSGYEPNFIKK